MKFRLSASLYLFIAALWLAGCNRRAADLPFDGVTGEVSTNHSLDQEALVPAEVKLKSDFGRLAIIEHLVFIGERDTLRRAATVTFRRALNDNEFLRAERDFSGFVYNGDYWQPLPYTKSRHDSTRLDLGYDFPFGGINWSEDRTAGKLHYDWRGVKLELDFRDLVVVENNTHGSYNQRTNAIGTGVMKFGPDTLAGTVFFELQQVEDYNPVNNIAAGIEYTNYDWIAVVGADGRALIASSDSTTEGDKLLKNFVTLREAGGIRYADGSSKVRINSAALARDHKIYDMLAQRKSLSVPELGLGFDLSLVDPRIFYTSGYCLSLVRGNLDLNGASQPVWGVIEHWQQPKSEGSVLQ
jgi:hypothetical protein